MADGCAARVGESPLEEKEEAGKTDRARRPIAVETNGSGGRLRPLRRSTNYPHCLFAFYATALANDISRSARCLATTRILYGKYLLGKGLDEGREGRVGFEDETIVWKSVSRRSPIIAAGRIY